MKFKKYILIGLTCILFSPLFCLAQADSLFLQGRFADTAGKSGYIIECKILGDKTPLDRQIMFTQTIRTKAVNGNFACYLPVISDQLEVTFSVVDREGKSAMINSGNNMEAVYSFHKDDQPVLLITEAKDIIFTGKGSARLNCQAKLYGLNYLPQSALERVNELSNNGNYLTSYRTYLLFLKQQLTFKRAILETYRDSISKEEFNQIWDDQKGLTYSAFFYGLHVTTGRYGSKGTADMKVFLKELGEQPSSPDTSQDAILSPYYGNSLLLKEVVRVRNAPGGDTTVRLDFGQLYRSVCTHYQGALKDHLIFLSFLEFSKINGRLDSLDEALNGMGDNESKRHLLEWRSKVATGSPAFAFELPNESGKTVRLKDLQGKIVICDFWFTGCENCIRIPPAMAAVCKKYAGNGKVVFLSINVDRQKKWWDFGLKQGVYTIPGAIHLSTFGEGMSHPLLQYFNYTSFPQLLVIGQDGKVISSFPPDPRIDQGKALIEMIDRHL